MREGTRTGGVLRAAVTIAALAGMAAPSTAVAEMYGYVDDDGRYRIVDSLGTVPEDKRAEAKRVDGGATRERPAATAPATRAPEASPRERADMPPGERPEAPARAPGGEEVFVPGKGFVPVAPEAPPPVAPAQPEEPVDDEGRNEMWWQRRVVEAANRRAAAEDALRQLEDQKRILTYGRPSEKTRYRKQLREAREELEAATRAIDEEIPAEARASGAPKSWLTLPGLGKPEDEKGRDRR